MLQAATYVNCFSSFWVLPSFMLLNSLEKKLLIYIPVPPQAPSVHWLLCHLHVFIVSALCWFSQAWFVSCLLFFSFCFVRTGHKLGVAARPSPISTQTCVLYARTQAILVFLYQHHYFVRPSWQNARELWYYHQTDCHLLSQLEYSLA